MAVHLLSAEMQVEVFSRMKCVHCMILLSGACREVRSTWNKNLDEIMLRAFGPDALVVAAGLWRFPPPGRPGTTFSKLLEKLAARIRPENVVRTCALRALPLIARRVANQNDYRRIATALTHIVIAGGADTVGLAPRDVDEALLACLRRRHVNVEFIKIVGDDVLSRVSLTLAREFPESFISELLSPHVDALLKASLLDLVRALREGSTAHLESFDTPSMRRIFQGMSASPELRAEVFEALLQAEAREARLPCALSLVCAAPVSAVVKCLSRFGDRVKDLTLALLDAARDGKDILALTELACRICSLRRSSVDAGTFNDYEFDSEIDKYERMWSMQHAALILHDDPPSGGNLPGVENVEDSSRTTSRTYLVVELISCCMYSYRILEALLQDQDDIAAFLGAELAPAVAKAVLAALPYYSFDFGTLNVVVPYVTAADMQFAFLSQNMHISILERWLGQHGEQDLDWQEILDEIINCRPEDGNEFIAKHVNEEGRYPRLEKGLKEFVETRILSRAMKCGCESCEQVVERGIALLNQIRSRRVFARFRFETWDLIGSVKSDIALRLADAMVYLSGDEELTAARKDVISVIAKIMGRLAVGRDVDVQDVDGVRHVITECRHIIPNIRRDVGLIVINGMPAALLSMPSSKIVDALVKLHNSAVHMLFPPDSGSGSGSESDEGSG